MFAKSLTIPLFIATAVLAVPTVVRRADVPLSDWSSHNLESYWTFKMRFNSLHCASQTGTDFYTTCCYPLGANESLSDRPAECHPTTCAYPHPSHTQPPAAPAPTQSVASVDEDLPFCEDGEDEWDDGDDHSSSTGNGDVPTSQYNYAPAPTPTQPATPTTQENSQPTTTQSNNSSPNADVQSGGFATFYYQNGNAGACGDFHGDGDLIAAIDVERYGDMSQRSSLCGQRVHIKNTNNGNTVEVVIADVCPTCANGNSIDLSFGAFSSIASPNEGMVPIEWYFI